MLKKIALAILAVVGFILTFGSEGAYNSGISFGEEDRQTITLSHMSWDDTLSSTAVITNVLEDEGFDVELIQLDPAILFSSVAEGESDFSVSPWLPRTHQTYMDQYGENIDLLGAHIEGAEVAMVVPTYMEDINSIEDLSDEANQTVTGIEPGAGITEQMSEAMANYDNLSDWDHQQSSTGAMLTSLGQALSNEEEIVIPGWTPHWKFIEYDLKMLEDPQGGFGTAENLSTIARQGFEEDNPVAYQIIDNFNLHIDDMQEIMLSLHDGMSPEAAARQWMDENPEKVAEWTEGIDDL